MSSFEEESKIISELVRICIKSQLCEDYYIKIFVGS